MQQTLLADKKLHILGQFEAGKVAGNINYGSTLCGRHVPETNRLSLFDANIKPPTCPECLSHHFSDLKTSYALTKKAKLAEEAASILINALDTLIRVQKYPDDRAAGKGAYLEGSFPFIPNSTSRIFREFLLLKEFLKKEKRWSGHNASPTKFVDAGCGIGNIMILADAVGLCSKTHGIEYFPETAKTGKTWLGVTKRDSMYNSFNIYVADIMKFRKYREYDIVYFYCPFSDERLQIMFEERLENNMKIGAVLVPHLKKGQAIRKDKRFKQLEIGKKDNSGYWGGPFAFIKVKDGTRKVSEVKKAMRRHMGGYGPSGVDKALKDKYNIQLP